MNFTDFKDYYATLGLARTASQDEVKRAYRKLARKFHPDVSKEPDAENRFKAVAEAHEALIDPERRAAYDDLAQAHTLAQARRRAGADAPGPNASRFSAPPGRDSGYEFSARGAASGAQRGQPGTQDFSAFFESLFGSRQGRDDSPGDAAMGDFMAGSSGARQRGADHHARIEISLADAYAGARHIITLRHPQVGSDGRMTMHERQVEVNIPKGVRPGQHLRLAGLGEMNEPAAMGPLDSAGHPTAHAAAGAKAGAGAGDLYLEIAIRPQPGFRLDGADVWCELAVAPWEAALGARVHAATPEGEVELAIPAGSSAGRKLRLKGRGLPGGALAGDLYAVLQISLPPADSAPARAAWSALADAFPQFDPRRSNEA